MQVTCGPASARAADQHDLNERIAELEETVAPSGSRPLQLNIYGQVNRALLFWNDGFDSGTYGVDNHTSSTRFGFVGQAAVGPGWSAGYRLEVETPFPSSDEVFNGPGGRPGGPAEYRAASARATGTSPAGTSGGCPSATSRPPPTTSR